MKWLPEMVLGGLLGLVNFTGNWANELRDRRDDVPATTEQKILKRIGTRCFFIALVAMGVALIVGCLPVRDGSSRGPAEQLVQMTSLGASCAAAILLILAMFCVYRAWRLEQT